jgi:hypothetical protein
MLNKFNHRAAFTLLEMTIAIALGTMIILVAVSGFRTASQTLTAANRLSLENSMLRSGYYEAQIQLDFWTNLDDPTKDDSERPLKSSTSVGAITEWTYQSRKRGLPFTPMATLHTEGIWQKSPSGVPQPSRSRVLPNGALVDEIMPADDAFNKNAALEMDRGWDPTYYWSPHDPRTWCRANLAEKERDNNGIGNDGLDNLPKMINGRYAIFANTRSTAQDLTSYSFRPDLNNTDIAQRQTKQAVEYKKNYKSANIHSWYYNQLNSLVNAMGYAAFCEYVPANSIYTWYSDSGDRTAGGINKFGIVPWYQFTNGDGDQRNSRGIYRNTYSNSYGYINPRSFNYWRVDPPPTSGAALSTSMDVLRQRFYQGYSSDYGATDGDGAKDLRWLLSHVNFPEKLLENKPIAWPDIDVSVGRIIKNAHHVAVAKVRRFSPFNGEVIELTWCGLGTTLRGARQQRKPDKGWAQWDNKSGSPRDLTLDSPAP